MPHIFAKIGLVAGMVGGLGTGIAQAASAIDVWAMAGGGDGTLWTIDAGAGTNTLIGRIKDPVLGDVGAGWSTVGETPDKTLYFMRRYQNDVNILNP